MPHQARLGRDRNSEAVAQRCHDPNGQRTSQDPEELSPRRRHSHWRSGTELATERVASAAVLVLVDLTASEAVREHVLS